ncbi:MAG: hypothetical protein ABL921_23580 [Pirellula sp.]
MTLNQNLQIGRLRDGKLLGLMGIAILMAFFAYIARLSDVTHDAFHEMALIRAFAETGQFPLNDVFAFTPTVEPTVHHEWGTGLVLYWVAGASPLGLDGMAILRMILVIAIAALAYRVARNNGSHPILIFLCAPILFPLLWVGFATLRAQLFTLLFLLLQMLLLQSDWQGKRAWVATWALLYVVWLNMHAGFVVGVAMLVLHVGERWLTEIWLAPNRLGVRAAYDKLWHHWILLPIIVLGLLVNPWGLAYAPYLLRAILMPRPTMLEWQPLWMTHDSFTSLAAFALSVLGLGYVAKNRQWTRLRGWLFCCIAAYMAMKHIRHGSIYALVWMTLMPGWLTPTAFGRSAIAAITNFRTIAIRTAGAIAVACSVFLYFHPLWKATLPSQDPHGAMVYPVDAVNFLREHQFSGNLMTPFASGAYVSWMCYPQIRVSIDGRYEVAYRDDVLPKHNRFYSAAPDWRDILHEFDADAVLVQSGSPVKKLLHGSSLASTGWNMVYEDKVFSVFTKEVFTKEDSGMTTPHP